MLDEILYVSQTQLTDWIKAQEHPPTVAGWYEVRNCGCWPRRKKLISGFAHGRQMRYWDGTRWMGGWDNTVPSIMGSHFSHQYRGLRAPAK